MLEKQAISPLGAFVETRRDSLSPVHTQLEEALRAAIRGGHLVPGARLPATRQLAGELGVSRGVVVEAYEQLVAEGYLTARTGSGTRVASAAAGAADAPSPADGSAAQQRVTFDFRPGSPDLTLFPRAGWSKALQRATRDSPHSDLGYGDPTGHPGARTALAGWLSRTRAAVATAGDVVLTSGFTQGAALICQVLRDRGSTELAVEDPGHPEQRDMLRQHGMSLRPVPVDEGGIDVDALTATGVRAVLVTPAHQFPTGVVLAPKRRAALLAWARNQDGLVIEDDYDAEYRYDRAPVGCLQGVAPDVVIYAGSASKMLAPALRLGWLLVPWRLAGDVAAAKQMADYGSPVLGQLALADLIDSGGLDRHLRHTRLRYRARRDHFVAALGRCLAQARVGGIAAGLHAVVELNTGTDERSIERHAEKLSVAVHGMYRYRADRTGPPALAVGYSRVPERSIDEGIGRLAEAIRRSQDVEGAGR
ncbi:MAG: PLP-dependent aminotransferase family protein [Pseudonocardiaceae bacterium]